MPKFMKDNESNSSQNPDVNSSDGESSDLHSSSSAEDEDESSFIMSSKALNNENKHLSKNNILKKKRFHLLNTSTSPKGEKHFAEFKRKIKKPSPGGSHKLNKFPSFLKRIRISSEDSESETKPSHIKKKRKWCSDSSPSFLQRFSASSSRRSDCEKNLPHRQSELFTDPLREHQKFHVEIVGDIPVEKKLGDLKIVKEPPPFSSFPVPSGSAEIVILQHPSSFTLYKYIDVNVVSGGISILGFTMNSLSPKARVFSFERTGLINLKTLHSDPMWKNKEYYRAIKKALKVVTSKENAQKILQKCDNSSVIVILERAAYPTPLQILTLYFPQDVWFKKHLHPNVDFTFKKKKDSHDKAMDFSPSCDELAETVKSAIRNTTLKIADAPRILVCGNGQTGKSTLLRYVINSVLSMFPHVFYLDLDPGQPEFTPPGVLSLTKVSKEMIGPSFSHLRTPLKMIFIGSDTAETSPPMYAKSVRQLMQYFTENYPRETLFVNTMGWMQGIGLEILESVRKVVEPSIIVEIKEPDDRPYIDTQTEEAKHVQHVIIQSIKKEVCSSAYSAKQKRNFSILAYFGKCSKPYLRPAPLNEIPAYCICWDNIPIYIFGKKVPPNRIVEAINASYVALCSVNDSLILDSDIPGFQSTLVDEPVNTCLGFGIVRAVDEANHLLYIITPLKLDELQTVNAIIRGKITLPDAVFLQQKITDTPLPFVDQSKTAPTPSRETVRNRIKRGQKTPQS